MTLAMLAFTLEDFTLKKATEFIPLSQLLIICGILGSIFFISCSRYTREPIFYKDSFNKTLIVRSIFEIMGRIFYALAIAFMPITNAASILQATPLVVVLGAVIFLNEKVGWRRWTAILTGFMGVLMIIQPGTNGFTIFSIFAVLGMIGFAGRDLATRMSPVGMSNYQLGSFGFYMVIIAGIILSVFNYIFFPEKTIWETISFDAWIFVFANAIAGVSAYFCLTIAMRIGDVSFVTPFRYVRVLFAMFFGVVILGEQPNALVIIGSIIIVLSGIYIIMRRNQKNLKS
ncbi:MAG: DMT family transporter [Rhizobiales bacterium]|nr:DMT family transporter [Hyphomicrobiales bacterium]